MKHLKIFFLTFLCILFYSVPIMAKDTSNTVTIETFEDGSYMESTIEESPDLLPFSTSSTKSGRKTSTYKSSSGKTIWSVTVTGTFTYNGSSAKCTKATVSTTCPNNNWKITKTSAAKSNAAASATATAKKYQDGSYIQSLTRTVKLTCSKSGKLS